MSKNENLHAAKVAKDDEYYTRLCDIESQMNAFIEYDKDVFRDKVVLCPCDDPEWSNFTKYFVLNFERLGLKKLISTSYAPGAANKQISLFESESNNFDKEKHETHGRIFILDRDKLKEKDMDRLVPEDLSWDYLEGDGDFRSEEVTKLRDEADILASNGPISLSCPVCKNGEFKTCLKITHSRLLHVGKQVIEIFMRKQVVVHA